MRKKRNLAHPVLIITFQLVYRLSTRLRSRCFPYMNLNTALMSQLQNLPTAPKTTLITFIIHPTLLLVIDFDLLQRL